MEKNKRKKWNGYLAAGLFMTGLAVFLGILGYFWTPYSTTAMSAAEKFTAPSMHHIFGTDNFGRDIFSRVMQGLIGVVIYTAAPVLIAAFNSEPDVVHYGVMQSRTIALFYFLLAFSHCIAAVLRGSGNASVPMIVMLCVWCLFRVSYITVTVHFIPDIRVIFWAYPLTWSISSVIFLALFLRGKWVYGFEKRK